MTTTQGFFSGKFNGSDQAKTQQGAAQSAAASTGPSAQARAAYEWSLERQRQADAETRREAAKIPNPAVVLAFCGYDVLLFGPRGIERIGEGLSRAAAEALASSRRVVR